MKRKSQILIIFLICSALMMSCRKTQNDYEILFVGIDALDWELMNPLLEQGKLPNFYRLKRMGTSAKINTNETGGSAVYWTSIATGQHADKHGIRGFVYVDPGTGEITPYTSNMRKTKAFWNILSDRGDSVGIIGWYISWPAEPVNGFIISSYMGMKEEDQSTWKGTIYAGSPGMVYPDELQAEVDEYIASAENIYIQRLRKIIKPKALLLDKEIIRSTKGSFLTDEIFHEAAINLLQKRRPRMFAVYFSCLDVVGHRFTHPDPEVQKSLDRKYGKVQSNYYLYMDVVLGLYMKKMRRNTILIVASDHGLRDSEHTDDGVFMAAGPIIKKNIWSEEHINLTDICPTILYLLGYPVSTEMDGRVYTGAVNDDFLVNNKIRFIPSYGQRETVESIPKKSQFDDDIVQRLKSLGYIK